MMRLLDRGVDTVVQRLFAVLEKLLGGERNKDSRGTGGQPPLNLDLIEAQGQRRHQPFFLLEVKPCQLAVVLLCDGTGLEHIVAQLPGMSRRVSTRKVTRNIRSFRLCKSCKSFLASAP